MRYQGALMERAADPLTAALSLLTPHGLGRLACASRLWRDVAAKVVGLPVHIYAISSHRGVLDSCHDDRIDGVAYLGPEPPPFDMCRGPSGGVLQLSLVPRAFTRSHEGPDDVDSEIEAVTVICASPVLAERVDVFIRALDAAETCGSAVTEKKRQVYFRARSDLTPVPNRLARLPRACDLIPMPILRQIAQKIVAASADTPIRGVDWARSLLGPSSLTLSDLRDCLRITVYEFEAPILEDCPYYDFTFFEKVLLKKNYMGALKDADLIDRIFGPHISAESASTIEKQKFAHYMNGIGDPERWMDFKVALHRAANDDLDEGQARAAARESNYTPALLDGMDPVHLNVWREMVRREYVAGDEEAEMEWY